MARYRKIDVRIWGDEKFQALSGLEPSGKALWLYLLTSPSTNSIPGLFRAGEAAMAEELEWPLKAFREAFAEVFREGLAEADWKARVVWIPKAMKYNRPESPNVVSSWSVSWDEIPECRLKHVANKALEGFTEGLGEAFAKAFAKACPKPSGKAMPNQEQEQEQEQEPEQESPLPPKGEVTVPVTGDFPPSLRAPLFEQAWKDWIAYRKQSRFTAWKPMTIAAAMKELEPLGPEGATAAIRRSIAKGWKGIFPDNGNGANGKASHDCDRCAGKGFIEKPDEHGGWSMVKHSCKRCQGTGKF